MHLATDQFDKLSNRLQASFIRLTKDEHLWSGDLYSALRSITTTLSDTLELERVSVWRLSDDRRQLVCQLLFRSDSHSFESGATLDSRHYPHYFNTLDASRVLDVTDALADPRMAELLASYIKPQGIGAMLEATLNEAGHFAGVLRLEQLGTPRRWSRDEHAFAISVADLLSQLQVFHTLKDRERSYRSIFDAAGDAIFTIVDGVITDCNPQALKVFGYSRVQLIGQNPAILSPAFQNDGRRTDEVAAEYLKAATEVGPQFFEWTHCRADGSRIEVEVSLSSIWLAGRIQITSIVRDITERRLAEQIRQTSAELLKQRNLALQVVINLASQLHRSSDSQAIAEETLRVLQLLQRAPLSLFHLLEDDGVHFEIVASSGYSPEQIAARRRMPLQRSLTAQALEQGKIMHSTQIADDPRVAREIKEICARDGIRSMTLLPLVYQDKPLGVIGLQFYEAGNEFADSELEILRAICQTVSLALANARNLQELEFQATHDSLTGLPNRTQLHRDATESLRWIAGGPRQLALLLLDLDRFKEVNDTLGHRTGDQLLKSLAARLQSEVNDHNAMLARLGGDEFAILLRSVGNVQEAIDTAQRLIKILRAPIEVEGIFIELGASIGISVYPQHGGTSHALLRCADVAMYAAKTSATSVSLYDNSHDAHNPRRLAMITELGSAIRGEQLVLHFQPRYQLQEKRWCSTEALVRWQHPRLGFIPPGEFVQFAETSELIRPLTLWVAQTAIRQLAAWQQAGLAISTSINLSTRNLLDITLPDALAELLQEYKLQPGSLELEITETALMTDPDRAMQTIERLSELGMHLSIDDFGTGYSSLAYLKRMPLHALKIDRSFVRDMLHDDQDAIIVRSTIGLAHSLGLQVVAEGVEDPATLARLREYGCDEAQGYVLSKPMPHALAFDIMQTAPPTASN